VGGPPPTGGGAHTADIDWRDKDTEIALYTVTESAPTKATATWRRSTAARECDDYGAHSQQPLTSGRLRAVRVGEAVRGSWARPYGGAISRAGDHRSAGRSDVASTRRWQLGNGTYGHTYPD
jgi:hypothetical protein